METQMTLTLTPSRLRHVWSRCLELAIASLLGIFTRMALDFVNSVPISPFGQTIEQVTSHLAGALVVALLIGLFDVEKFSITISEGVIEGPSRKDSNKRTSFSIDRLDRAKMEDRNIFQRFFGQRILHSFDGEEVLLNEAVFSPAQIQTLFQKLNYTTL
jgi:hypothetical protein